jgi:hypothetical protein
VKVTENVVKTITTAVFSLLIAGCIAPTGTSIETAETAETTETAETSPKEEMLPPLAPTVTDESLLVVPNQDYMSLYDNTGKEVYSWRWGDIIESGMCDGKGAVGGCTGEGSSPDGDGLLVSYRQSGIPVENELPSGVIRFSLINGVLTPDWQKEGFVSYIHDVARTPDHDTGLIILETLLNQISWFTDQSDPNPSFIITEDSPAWKTNLVLPNGFEQFSSQGRDFLLVNWRNDSGETQLAGGLISLWDISEPKNPVTIWDYPEDGRLREPHGATLRYYNGEIYLLYGHPNSYVNTSDKRRYGTIGIAKSSDLFSRPSYLADISPAGDLPSMQHPRYADLTAAGDLIITDTGDSSKGKRGWVWQVPLPSLVPTDKSGGQTDEGENLHIIELNSGELIIEDISNPFEAWFWTPPA